MSPLPSSHSLPSQNTLISTLCCLLLRVAMIRRYKRISQTIGRCKLLLNPGALSHYTLGPDFSDMAKVPPNTSILFLLSISTAIRNALLQHADMVLYTPAFEHFGIVPLEAMLASKPVLAINSGGPLETIKDNETGWLRPENEWTRTLKIAMLELDDAKRASMGAAGRAHVQANFSLRAMATQLEKHVMTAQRREKFNFNPFITLSVIVTMLSLIAGYVVTGYLQ